MDTYGRYGRNTAHTPEHTFEPEAANATPHATRIEHIERKMHRLTAEVAYWQAVLDAREQDATYPRIPDADAVSEYQAAVDSLESFADYWGFDC